jgi:hypothetical protein
MAYNALKRLYYGNVFWRLGLMMSSVLLAQAVLVVCWNFHSGMPDFLAKNQGLPGRGKREVV